MKNKLKLIIILLCLTLFLFVGVSLSKYVFSKGSNISIKTGKFYFETNASDITLPISNPTFNIDIENYLGSDYTEYDIDYKISISDGNGVNNDYNFRVNNGSVSSSDYYERTLNGGSKNQDSLTITLDKVVTNSIIEENVYFKIEALGPYKKTIEFVVTVVNPSGFEVTGNPTNWTKNDVTLTVVPDDPSKVSYYSFDDGQTWQSSPSKLYTQNEAGIKIRVKDNLNNESDSVTINITKIDKEAPDITINDGTLIATLDESNLFTSLITTSDLKSGVSSDGLVVKRNNTVITNTNYFNYPGLYAISLEAEDNVGNKNTISTSILVRWPTGGKYVVRKTELDGDGIAGEGLALTGLKDGLYKDTVDTGLDESLDFSSKYYYTGKNVNNNVSFANGTYQILNVSVSDDVKLIAPLSANTIGWGNAKIYDSTVYSNWINKFSPRGYIYNSDDSNFYQFTETEWSHVIEATFYAGRFERSNNDTLASTINLERTGATRLGADSSSAAFTSKVAFPNVSDYLKACNYMDLVYSIRTSQLHQPTFRDYNWLASRTEQWTMNSKLENVGVENDYWVLDYGTVGNEMLSNTYYLKKQYRPVFYISSETILSGSGTSDDPYTVQEDWSWFDNYQTLQ